MSTEILLPVAELNYALPDEPSGAVQTDQTEVEELRRSLTKVLGLLERMLPLLETLGEQIEAREQELQSLRNTVAELEQAHS